MTVAEKLRAIERIFIAIGCVCFAWLLAGLAGGATFLTPVIRNHGVELSVARVQTPGLLARLDIPALHLSLPVVEGTDTASLGKAVGHVPGTAMPGGLGNVGLAAHRDTFFRPLRNISKGMDVVLENRDGAYHYSVVSTEIVSPEAIKVLDISTVPELTLITCFPFDYVGSAPHRFIVHAQLKSASAEDIPSHSSNRLLEK